MNAFAELGIAATMDRRSIRQAYAVKLKQIHPEDDPEGFQRLRAAYEHALAWASPQEEPHFADNSTLSRQPVDSSNEPEGPAAEQETHYETAVHLVKNIFDTVESRSLEDAVQILDETVQSAALENIELKMIFEDTLARAFLECDQSIFPFAEKAIARLGWDRLPPSQSGSSRYVVTRMEGWSGYQRLLKFRAFEVPQRKLTREEQIRAVRARASEMLTSPYNERLFYWNRVSCFGLTYEVAKQLHWLQAYAPGTLREYLDARTVTWWAKRNPYAFLATLICVPMLSFLIFSEVHYSQVFMGIGAPWPAWLMLFSCYAILLGIFGREFVKAVLKEFVKRLRHPRSEEGFKLYKTLGIILISAVCVWLAVAGSVNLAGAGLVVVVIRHVMKARARSKA